MTKKKPAAKPQVKPFRLPPPSHAKISFMCNRERAILLRRFATELAKSLEDVFELK